MPRNRLRISRRERIILRKSYRRLFRSINVIIRSGGTLDRAAEAVCYLNHLGEDACNLLKEAMLENKSTIEI